MKVPFLDLKSTTTLRLKKTQKKKKKKGYYQQAPKIFWTIFSHSCFDLIFMILIHKYLIEPNCEIFIW